MPSLLASEMTEELLETPDSAHKPMKQSLRVAFLFFVNKFGHDRQLQDS